jgi:CRP-like cAMP-binding protein
MADSRLARLNISSSSVSAISHSLGNRANGAPVRFVRSESLLARRIANQVELSKEELSALNTLESKLVEIKRGQELAKEGEGRHKAYILHSGWACSYKLTPRGGRQIVRFPIPGDIMGYRSLLLPKSDQFLCVLTDAVVSPVEGPQAMDVFVRYPRLGTAILQTLSREEAMVVDHFASVGRRSAVERVAYFFLQLAERLSLVGLATDMRFKCPLNQHVIGDALGLSAIHVNRVLRQLRELNLLTMNGCEVVIHDRAALEDLSGYSGLAKSTIQPFRTGPFSSARPSLFKSS